MVSLDGRVELDYSAYDHQLGVAAVRWSPSGHMLAIASHDNKVGRGEGVVVVRGGEEVVVVIRRW